MYQNTSFSLADINVPLPIKIVGRRNIIFKNVIIKKKNNNNYQIVNPKIPKLLPMSY